MVAPRCTACCETRNSASHTLKGSKPFATACTSSRRLSCDALQKVIVPAAGGGGAKGDGDGGGNGGGAEGGGGGGRKGGNGAAVTTGS